MEVPVRCTQCRLVRAEQSSSFQRGQSLLWRELHPWEEVSHQCQQPPQNAADQFPEEKRERYCRKAQKLVSATLAATRFAGCPVVPVAARPGGGGGGGSDLTVSDGGTAAEATSSAPSSSAPVGIQQLTDTLLERVRLRPGAAATGSSGSEGGSSGVAAAGGKAQPAEPFLFFIDHCFAIRGQGTVLTGGRKGAQKPGTALPCCMACRSPTMPRPHAHSCRHACSCC